MTQRGIRNERADWLRSKFGYRSPRVDRLADVVLPQQFVAYWLAGDWTELVGLRDSAGDGAPFFSLAQFEGVSMSWDELFLLETMHLENRPRIDVEENGTPTPGVRRTLGSSAAIYLVETCCSSRKPALPL